MIKKIEGCGINQTMILILSNKWDISADFVVRELHKRNHPFLRLNTEDLVNDGISVSLPDCKITVSKNNKTINLLDKVKVIWNRRPGKPYDDIENVMRPSAAVQSFVNNQWYSLLESLQIIENCVWINNPKDNERMESKILQLYKAQMIGFKIPNTLISNDPSSIFKFQNENNYLDGIIIKALYSPLIEEPEQDYFIFTNCVEDLKCDNLDELRTSPSIFQEPLIPKVDYRVTVIDENVFSVKIVTQKNNGIDDDWRKIHKDINFIPDKLPSNIENNCISIVKGSGLIFGAIDLVFHNNDYYFLEINPNGEWGWLQKPVGLPIAEKLCDYMVSLDV